MAQKPDPLLWQESTCISETATEFDNNCYELFTINLNWTEAQEYCSNGIGSLATISSPSVLSFLNSLIPDYTQAWVGASDQLQEGEWVWTDGTEANLTSMWDEGEPNNQIGIEHCLEINYRKSLNDLPCSLYLSFICMEVHESTSSSETEKTTSVTSSATTESSSFSTVRNMSNPGNVSDDTMETTTTSETETTPLASIVATTATSNFSTVKNVSTPGNVSDHTMETTTTSKNETTPLASIVATTVASNFSTVRNMSKPENVSGDTMEKMNSPGVAVWLGIGAGIFVVVTFCVLIVVLARRRRKTRSLRRNLKIAKIQDFTHQPTTEYDNTDRRKTCPSNAVERN
ncbi:E-selectin-like [Physella acuta]|uniref:E-selectin-like n=1 Tax=Physella acuta TaxID=109671 RepID=UPI0027DC8248|nr:E-selectin-like [Physella acuta]